MTMQQQRQIGDERTSAAESGRRHLQQKVIEFNGFVGLVPTVAGYCS